MAYSMTVCGTIYNVRTHPDGTRGRVSGGRDTGRRGIPEATKVRVFFYRMVCEL